MNAPQAQRLGDLTPQQWRSGIAAWLGWFFDGLDMHLYALVAAPFVMILLHASSKTDPQVQAKAAWVQAAFLVGWALGGGFFGTVGDRLGRSRTLGLTILTYAAFTGLSYFSQTWWQLLIFRFMAALGIGGEWAVGSALLAETWPSKWRPWAAACLQTAVNMGVLLACAVVYAFAPHVKEVFLVGILPALIVFWIRKSVPETDEWLAAQDRPEGRGFAVVGVENSNEAEELRQSSPVGKPTIFDLFRGPILGITIRVIIVCACSLTVWWAFMFWIIQHVPSLPDIKSWPETERNRLGTTAFFLLIGTSIPGNFFAATLAKLFGYRRAIAMLLLCFFLAMAGTFYTARTHVSLLLWLPWIGFFSGLFGLFTMYLPPLFPTLLRTTGAGFCYNIGRLAAAFGTVFFGLFAKVGDFRMSLLLNSLLLIPAIAVAMTLPDLEDGKTAG